MTRPASIAVALAISLVGAGGVHAASLITNGSFETGGPTAGNSTNPNIGDNVGGWTVINNNGTTTNNGRNIIWLADGAYGLYTPYGVDFIDLTGTTDSAPFDGLSQAVATTPNQTYTLSFAIGAQGPASQGMSGVYGGPIAVTATAGSTSQTFIFAGIGGTSENGTNWSSRSLTFTANSASTNISFVGGTGNQFIGLDNVSLDVAAAPEPATWALMIAGVGLAGATLRRRKAASPSAA